MLCRLLPGSRFLRSVWCSCAGSSPHERCRSGCTAPVKQSWPKGGETTCGGRCHAKRECSALHLYTTGSKEGCRSCGRAVSVLARQQSGWSRDLVEPRLLSARVSSVEGQALKRRKEMLTLGFDVQPIDNRFGSARPLEQGYDRHRIAASKLDEEPSVVCA